MSTPSTTRARAVLLVEKTQIPLLLPAAKAIYNGMLAAVATFPSPVPTLVIVLAQITTLETAQLIVTSGVHGTSTATRNVARDTLWASLRSLKTYVQAIADASEANAIPIIKSAGFDVAAAKAPVIKPILEALLTGISGEVKLTANVRALVGSYKRRAVYNWQYSIDGGHTWTSAPSSIEGTTSIDGLPVMTNCSFRVCVTLKKVMQPWSQVVTIAVH